MGAQYAKSSDCDDDSSPNMRPNENYDIGQPSNNQIAKGGHNPLAQAEENKDNQLVLDALEEQLLTDSDEEEKAEVNNA